MQIAMNQKWKTFNESYKLAVFILVIIRDDSARRKMISNAKHVSCIIGIARSVRTESNNKSMNLRMSETFHRSSNFKEQLNVKQPHNVTLIVWSMAKFSHSKCGSFPNVDTERLCVGFEYQVREKQKI